MLEHGQREETWGDYFTFLTGWYMPQNLKRNGLSVKEFWGFFNLFIVGLGIPYLPPDFSGNILNPFFKHKFYTLA